MTQLTAQASELWARRPYTVVVAVVAPLVFALTFGIIWALSSGGNDPVTPVAAQQAQGQQQTDQPNQPNLVRVTTQQQTDQGAAQSDGPNGGSADVDSNGVRITRVPPDDQDSPQQGAQQQSQQQQAQQQAEQDGIALPALEQVATDDLDDDFDYGSDGEEGAILPIDNGVVPSSGDRFATDWELLVPSASIRAAIVRVSRTPAGAMGAPDNPYVIGWADYAAAPGGESGNALLVGHRDYQDIEGNVGVGVCWELERTKVGDQIIVRDQALNRAYVYEVIERAKVSPYDRSSGRYLRDSDTPIVTLITCTGSFDQSTNTYSHRFILVGSLVATTQA